VYQKLMHGEVLAPAQRLLWSRWILCQFARTPTLLLELAGFEEDVLSHFPEFGRDFSWAETDAKIDAAIEHISDFPARRPASSAHYPSRLARFAARPRRVLHQRRCSRGD
jgi:hypothetical protein